MNIFSPYFYKRKAQKNSAKVRLNRAKSMLRTDIEKSYAAEELFEFNLCYCNPFTERVMNKINQFRVLYK
jgi:RNA polymerase sigma-70 factor (ECF subfamily)